MKDKLLNIYAEGEQVVLASCANNEIQDSEDYDFDLPAYSLLYKYDENIIFHSPNTNSLLGLNLDLAC
jgi:hypothetical protein